MTREFEIWVMMKSFFLSLLLVSVLNSFSEVQGGKWKGEGTTQNLESIVIGRCYEYIRIVNPSVGEKNCSEMWEAFKNAFINKDPCSIVPKDYELFINLSLHPIPPNKSLFWENNQLLVNSFAGRGRRYMSLADTLFGFFGDFLNWCGQANSTGLDYESCPTTEECENNAVESFWRMASVTYAQHSSGVIHVLLNGSAVRGAYPAPGLGHREQTDKHGVATYWSLVSHHYTTDDQRGLSWLEMDTDNHILCFHDRAPIVCLQAPGGQSSGHIATAGLIQEVTNFEIPHFQKGKISQIVIWVVDDVEGPDTESCGTHSVKTLETRLKTLGYDVTCTDNYKSVMFLLCLDYPDHSKCTLSSSAPAAQRGPVSSDRGGSWNKLMFVSFVGFLFRFALVY